MPRETRARKPVSYADSGSSTPAWMVRRDRDRKLAHPNGATNGRFQKKCLGMRDGWRSNDPRDANGMGLCDACATITRYEWDGRRDAAMRTGDARGSSLGR
jgi:hypothetical protein